MFLGTSIRYDGNATQALARWRLAIAAGTLSINRTTPISGPVTHFDYTYMYQTAPITMGVTGRIDPRPMGPRL